MRSRQLDRLVTEVLRRIGEASSSGGASILPVLSVNNDDNTVSLDLGNGQTLDGVSAQAGYIPQVGHYATIIRNGMDLIVQPPQGAMTSPGPAAPTGLAVTPGIQALVAKWDEAPEANVKNNRGFYQWQSSDDEAQTENVTSHVVAATTAIITPVTGPQWVSVRAIDEAGVPGPYCAPVQGTPTSIPTPDGSDITQALLDAASATSVTLATDAMTLLLVTPDGTIAKADASFGKVTADEIEAEAIGAVAVGAYKLTAVNIDVANLIAAFVGANQITAANIDVTDLVASIVDTNALYGKLIVGPTIETATSGSYVRLSAANPTVIEFVVDGSTSGVVNQSGFGLAISPPAPSSYSAPNIALTSAPAGSNSVTINADTTDAYGALSRHGQDVWARDDLYVVQVAFNANASSPFTNSVSYSCPFTPSKCVATSNTQGAMVNSASSVGQYGCTVQATAITGQALASGTLVYATLILS